jgi:predicted lipoprotein with Yx(FWY)xxD motif
VNFDPCRRVHPTTPQDRKERQLRRELKMAVALTALVVGVAACGGGSSGSSSNASSGGGVYSQPAATPKAAAGVTVKVATTKLGRILTDANGRTLYLFKKDNGAMSSCSGACASIWPPLTAGTRVAGPGIAAAKLGSIKRADGKTEATYAGHPLYTYAGDTKPGDTHGQGLDDFGAEWYVLAPSGRQIGD